MERRCSAARATSRGDAPRLNMQWSNEGGCPPSLSPPVAGPIVLTSLGTLTSPLSLHARQLATTHHSSAPRPSAPQPHATSRCFQHLQHRRPAALQWQLCAAASSAEPRSRTAAPDAATSAADAQSSNGRDTQTSSESSSNGSSHGTNGSVNNGVSAAAPDDAGSASSAAAQEGEPAADQVDVSGSSEAAAQGGAAQIGQPQPGSSDDERRAGMRVAVLQATKSDAVEVEERDRSLGTLQSLYSTVA